MVMKNVTTDDPNVETEYVMYTDVDVLFWDDVTSCSFEKPAVLSLAGEHIKGTRVNSGPCAPACTHSDACIGPRWGSAPPACSPTATRVWSPQVTSRQC
jgi:hypothetical protein